MCLELPTKEQFIEQLNDLGELFIKKWKNIIPLSISIWAGLPFVRMFFWQVIYMLNNSEWVLNKMIQATFSINMLLPSVSGFIVDPIGEVISIISIGILVTIVFYLKENM